MKRRCFITGINTLSNRRERCSLLMTYADAQHVLEKIHIEYGCLTTDCYRLLNIEFIK